MRATVTVAFLRREFGCVAYAATPVHLGISVQHFTVSTFDGHSDLAVIANDRREVATEK